MPSLGNTPRPAYVYDTETDTWVPIGVGAHTHDDLYINQSVIDAKGDLLAGTADNSYGRLPAGANGTVLVSDSSTTTGLTWQPYTSPITAGKNFIINGNFDIWQRGTSFVNPNNVYTADRWYFGSANQTLSRQSSGAPSGSRYYIRSTSTGASYTDYFYLMESDHTSALLGRNVTLSFKIRKSGTAFVGDFIARVQKSSTVDAGVGATWTSIDSLFTNTAVIASGTSSSDWTDARLTVFVPNDGTANSLRVVMGFSSPQSSGNIIDISQVQLEAGSYVTTFSRAGGTIQGELAACQRYYVRFTAGGDNYVPLTSIGLATATNIINNTFQFPVTMRTAPSAVDFSSLSVYGGASGNNPGFLSVSNLVQNRSSNSISEIASTVSGASLGGVYRLQPNNAAGFVGFSAEL